MNILISCYSFYPSVGGLEEVNALLARAFVARGHAVKVVTMTRSTEPDNDTFDIMRGAGHIRYSFAPYGGAMCSCRRMSASG